MSDQKPQSFTPAPAKPDAARKSAQNHFAAAERRDVEVRKEIEAQRAALAARTAKLRALRLAKEEADRTAAANAPAPASRKSKRQV